MIEHMNDILHPTPEHIFWFYGIETQTVKKLSEQNNVTTVKGIPAQGFDDYMLPDSLFVIDDLLLESCSNKHITNLFCRQAHHNRITCILITQDLFCNGSQRKTFLRNAQYLCLFKNPLDHSIVYSVAQKIMPKNVNLFLNMYNRAVSIGRYLFIDGTVNGSHTARFRTNIFGKYQNVFICKID